jgi:hypothetical protein
LQKPFYLITHSSRLNLFYIDLRIGSKISSSSVYKISKASRIIVNRLDEVIF